MFTQEERRLVLCALLDEAPSQFMPAPTVVGWFMRNQTSPDGTTVGTNWYVLHPSEEDERLPGGCLLVATLGNGYSVYRYGRSEMRLADLESNEALLGQSADDRYGRAGAHAS